MDFRIADTFTDSLARLTGEEQKAVKTTAFDLQLNPANPGMSFHKLDKAKDKKFWSVRVGSDIRLIVHKSESSLMLCYVDHHDKAYAWAERRKLEAHPKTGAVQLVEIRRVGCDGLQEALRRAGHAHLRPRTEGRSTPCFRFTAAVTRLAQKHRHAARELGVTAHTATERPHFMLRGSTVGLQRRADLVPRKRRHPRQHHVSIAGCIRRVAYRTEMPTHSGCRPARKEIPKHA